MGASRGATLTWPSVAGRYSRPEDAQFLPSSDPAFDVLFALQPARALAWSLSDYENSQGRWRAGSA